MNNGSYFSGFELPDTFQSWFLVLQLHVWITISAAISDKKGKLFRLSLVDSMWNDVELRLEKLAVSSLAFNCRMIINVCQSFLVVFINTLWNS